MVLLLACPSLIVSFTLALALVFLENLALSLGSEAIEYGDIRQTVVLKCNIGVKLKYVSESVIIISFRFFLYNTL